MGREWYFGGSTTKREKRENTTTPVGCMSAVFQLFDFHHFHPCFNQSQSHFIHQDPINININIIPKGVEAPRNSLESEDVFMEVVRDPFHKTREKQQHNLNIPMCNIKIKTSKDGYSESADSPSTKSPNLVARLMGLDLLPIHHNSHSQSPTTSSSSSSNHNHTHLNPIPLRTRATNRRTCSENHILGTRSLPETPRVSSERKSDADLNQNHRRLSLQIIREKLTENDENANTTTSSSPGHYARQIVKQVSESVGRKVGVDITNIVKNRVLAEEIRRDKNLLGTKLKKSTNSNSPRLFENKQHKSYVSVPTIDNHRCDLESDVLQTRQRSVHKLGRRSQKITTGGHEFKTRLEKQVRREDQIVRQPATLSNDFLLPLKKCPSPTATKLPQKKAVADGPKRASQLSSNPCLTFKQQVTRTSSIVRETTQSDGTSDIEYVTKILKRHGIDTHTNLSFAMCFSRSHPLNPTIFNDLESTFHCTLRFNHRRLIFDLIDEILVDVLRPHINMKPWVVRGDPVVVHHLKGSHLIEKICATITSYPTSSCEDLQDIDAIIEKDLHQASLIKSSVEFEEEDESIAFEIAKDMMESLVHETLVLLYG